MKMKMEMARGKGTGCCEKGVLIFGIKVDGLVVYKG